MRLEQFRYPRRQLRTRQLGHDISRSANADSASVIVLEPIGRIIPRRATATTPPRLASIFVSPAMSATVKLDRSFSSNGVTVASYVANVPGGQSDVLTLVRLGDGKLLTGGHCCETDGETVSI